MTDSFDNLVMVDGIDLVSLFANSCNCVRDERQPMLDGILPNRLFVYNDMTDSFDKLVMVDGIDPVSMFANSRNCVRDERQPMLEGILPNRLF